MQWKQASRRSRSSSRKNFLIEKDAKEDWVVLGLGDGKQRCEASLLTLCLS